MDSIAIAVAALTNACVVTANAPRFHEARPVAYVRAKLRAALEACEACDGADADEAPAEDLAAWLRGEPIDMRAQWCPWHLDPAWRELHPCDHCGWFDTTFDDCPYAAEIHGDHTPVWMCESCRRQAADDI